MGQKNGAGGFIAFLLVLLGAINWGFVGAFNVDLVETLLGTWPTIVRIVRIAVGIAGILGLATMAKCGGRCGVYKAP